MFEYIALAYYPSKATLVHSHSPMLVPIRSQKCNTAQRNTTTTKYDTDTQPESWDLSTQSSPFFTFAFPLLFPPFPGQVYDTGPIGQANRKWEALAESTATFRITKRDSTGETNSQVLPMRHQLLGCKFT